MVTIENNFSESMIPDFVWNFAKKHTTSMIVSGILAFIVWNYLKKHKDKIKESFGEKTITERLDNMIFESQEEKNARPY